MTRNELVEQNIALTFDFLRYIIKHPEILEDIPDGSEIEFLEFDLPSHISEGIPDNSSDTTVFKVEHIFSKVGIETRKVISGK